MRVLLSILLFFFFSFTTVVAFDDVENNWYKESVNALKNNWVVNWYSEDVFWPHNNITRAEILKIIMESAEIDLDEVNDTCFQDVDINSWQAKYICTWEKMGIVKGYWNGKFEPNWKVTILEVLAFAFRTFEVDLSSYDDSWEWYEQYQDFSHQNKIIASHTYTINNYATRWLSSSIIYRLFQYKDGKKLNYNSFWCNKPAQLKSWEYSINVNWNTRKYLLYVPSNIDYNSPKSLIVAFHWRTNSNDMVRDYMKIGWWRYGDTNSQKDFIVAYPAGKWSWPYSWYEQENIDFFDSLITYLNEQMCIDRDKVFSVGHSLWSWMSNKVSCLRWDVIRAMVWVASDWYNNNCYWAVSSLITHLKPDHLATYQGWLNAYSYKSSNNMCLNETKNTSLWDIRSCEQKTYCAWGNTVTFCNSYNTYQSDPHSWPKDWSDDILNYLKWFK